MHFFFTLAHIQYLTTSRLKRKASWCLKFLYMLTSECLEILAEIFNAFSLDYKAQSRSHFPFGAMLVAVWIVVDEWIPFHPLCVIKKFNGDELIYPSQRKMAHGQTLVYIYFQYTKTSLQYLID